MLTHDQIQKIKNFAKDKPIEVVYLFGSQLTGQIHPQSDFDFGLLFSKNTDPETRSDLKMKAINFLVDMTKHDFVDVLDLETVPLRFQFEAIKNKGDVYCNNRQIRDNFEISTTYRYYDYRYRMGNLTQNTLQKVANQGFN